MLLLADVKCNYLSGHGQYYPVGINDAFA